MCIICGVVVSDREVADIVDRRLAGDRDEASE